jgi:glycosyltransferase involved in cell wall biosynthesis
MLPTVSVVITSYNYGRYIGAAIESVLTQDFRDFELIISDNASTDDSIEVISRYLGDERVRLIRRPTNIGAIANYQAALQETNGRYIASLSADDFFLAGHLRTMVRYYEDHSDVDVAWSGYVLAMPDGSIRDAFFSAFTEARNRNDFASLLSYDMYPCYPTILLKREILEEFAIHDPAFVAGDLEYVVRLAAAGKRFACVGNATVAWRQHGDNMSGGKYVRSGEQIEDQLRLLEKYAVEENARKIIGYGTGILGMLEHKHFGFVQENPQLAAEREPDIARRKAVISERVRRFAIGAVPAGPEGPLVSIVLPTIGKIPYLVGALQSIAVQTYANWEIILVSDGGPNLEHFVGSLPYADRVTYVRRTNREGPATARNTAFDFLHGGIVAYLDEDNLWDPRHLEVVVAALSGGALAVRTEASLIVEQMDQPPGGRRDVIRSRRPFASASDTPDPYLSHAVPLNAVAHDMRCYQQCGLFDKQYLVLEDWEFLVRLQAQFAVVSVPECTVEIRVRPALEGQHLGANWGGYPAAIEKLYNAHLNSPTGTAGEARLALFQSVRDAATRALRAPEDIDALEAMFVALGGMRRDAAMIS